MPTVPLRCSACDYDVSSIAMLQRLCCVSNKTRSCETPWQCLTHPAQRYPRRNAASHARCTSEICPRPLQRSLPALVGCEATQCGARGRLQGKGCELCTRAERVRAGKEIFAEALAAGTATSFFSLIEVFSTQDEPAFCGLASLAMILNSLAIGGHLSQPWRSA